MTVRKANIGAGLLSFAEHLTMKTVEKWLWRIRWAGRQTTTPIHYTEAEIRREHPEAVRIDASRVEVQLPDTLEELNAAMRQRGDR